MVAGLQVPEIPLSDAAGSRSGVAPDAVRSELSECRGD